MEILLLFVLLLLFLALGIPVAVSVGLAALGTILLAGMDVPLTLVPRQIFAGLNSYTLMAVPFFIMAGEMMNASGVTDRIIRLSLAAVGHIRGSLAQVNVFASLLMSGVSGSGAADTAALGTVLIPEMKKEGYAKAYAVAVTTSSATVGPIVPPSVLFVIYGSLTGVSVGSLFLGGILPGVLMGLLMMVVAYFTSRKHGYQQDPNPFNFSYFASALLGGLVAMVVPLVIVGSILFGLATATEVGVVALLIGFLLGALVFGKFRSWHELADVVTKSVKMSAVIMFIIATSGFFANVLTRLRFQDILLGSLTSLTNNPTIILVLIVVSLLVLGAFVDVTPLLIMFAGPLFAVSSAIGYDPIFFGVVVVLAATIGAVTPPVGGFLIIASGIAKIPITQAVRPLVPFWGALTIALALLVAFPSIVTLLPSLAAN